MAQPVIQTSFNAGEWAPALNARVDLGKYHSGAALLRNFFVDYRGGASTRAGTEYILRAFRSSTPVRLISFQASFTVSYVLEFGQNYIRFYSNGAPVLEATNAITNITNAAGRANLSVINSYSTGDWIFITGVGGAIQLNGKYFIVAAVNGTNVELTDLFGNDILFASLSAYTSGGTTARVYTLPSPYVAADLAGLKFAGNVNTMVLCHPSYVPYILTLVSANNWTIVAISFGTNVTTPTGLGITTSGAGTMNYTYVVTAVDTNGQESAVSATQSTTITNAAGAQAIVFSWGSVSGAVSYNVYRAGPASGATVPTGSSFGFVANVTGISFADCFTAGISVFPADFSLSIPITQNPFQGAGVQSVTITSAGVYTSVPSVTFAAAPAGGSTATGSAVLQIQSVAAGGASSNNWVVGDTAYIYNLIAGFPVVGIAIVATVAAGAITAFEAMSFPGSNPGSITAGAVPASTAVGNHPNKSLATKAQNVTCTWGVGAVVMISNGSGYLVAPAVTFSAGAPTATATAVLQPSSGGGALANPSVPIFFDQRLVLGGPLANPHQFQMSQPGSYFNFNVSDPVQPDDAITGTLVAQKLNSIQSFTVMSAGLITLTDQQAWLINGGAAGAPPTPIELAANGQAYNGSSALPPIIANLDILYVQAKGSIVRDLTFNFYTNIYTGADISVLSSHLFYGFTLTEWAYAEEPFKVVWAVRDDGALLSLTFVKEQELIGWAHSDTEGDFKSICSVTEQVTTWNGNTISVDAVYVVVERAVNGTTVKYIERMAERLFQYGVEDAWAVDSALQSVAALSTAGSLGTGVTLALSTLTLGTATLTASSALFVSGNVGQIFRMAGGIMVCTAFNSNISLTVNITQAPSRLVNPPGTWTNWIPSTTFSGGEHLAGKTCTGLADGAVIPPFVMPSTGIVTLAAPATKVTVGLSFLPQLKTLALDLGQPTVQGKRKKIVGVSARCQDTLGLEIGKTFDSSSLVPMDDLVVGNLGSQTNEVVTNRMVTGDAWQIIDQEWDVAGNYCIQQPQPFPASILGVIPDVTVGDS